MSQQAVTIRSTAVQVFTPIEFENEVTLAETKLSELKEKNKDVPVTFDGCETKEQRKAVKEQMELARADYWKPAIALEDKFEETVKDLRAQVNKIADRGLSITAQWRAEEAKYKTPLAEEKKRADEEKRIVAEAEEKRVAEGNALIKELSLIPSKHSLSSSIEIEAAIAELSTRELIEESLLEFFDDALSALNTSLETLNTLLESKKQAEAAAAKLAEERATFLAEQESARTKQAAIDLANKQAAEARQAEIDAENARVTEAAAAKQALIDAANAATAKALADQQAEIARQAKELQDKQNEAARVEQEKIDAKARKAKEAEAEKVRLAAAQKALEESEAHKAWLVALTPQEAFEYILERSQDSGIQEVCRAMLAK